MDTFWLKIRPKITPALQEFGFDFTSVKQMTVQRVQWLHSPYSSAAWFLFSGRSCSNLFCFLHCQENWSMWNVHWPKEWLPYRLNDTVIVFRFLAYTRNFSLLQNSRLSLGVHQSSSNIWEQPQEIKFWFTKKIKSRFQGIFSIYHSAQNLSFSSLLSKNIKIETFITNFVSFRMGVKHGLSHWVRNTGWGYSRIGYWGRYMGLRARGNSGVEDTA